MYSFFFRFLVSSTPSYIVQYGETFEIGKMSSNSKAILPSLRGMLVQDGSNHVCKGVWALNSAAHEIPGQTSEFQFELITPADATIDPSKTFPISGKYEGWFNLQQVSGVPAKFDDSFNIMFAHNASLSSDEEQIYNIEGSGMNKFGNFTVSGRLTSGGSLEMHRIYPRVAVRGTTAPKGGSVTTDGSIRVKKEKDKAIGIRAGDSDPSSAAREKRTPQPLLKCMELIREISKLPSAIWFNEPVNYVKLNIPDYPAIIKEPMCFQTIKTNLDKGTYSKPEHFAEHVRLTFRNALTYNSQPENAVHIAAKEMATKFEERYRVVVLGYAPGGVGVFGGLPNAQGAPASGTTSKKTKRPSTNLPPSKVLKVSTGPRGSWSGPGSNSGAAFGSGGGGTQQVVEMQRRMLEMQNEIRRLQKQADPSVVPSSSSSVIVSDFSYEEKRDLIARIHKLPNTQMIKVIEIVKAALMPGRHKEINDEVQVDINDLDNNTLKRLQRLVTSANSKKRKL
jgi:hypothetical protein